MTNDDKQDGRTLAALAALDCLDDEDARSWREHVAVRPQLAQEADSFKGVVEALGFLADEIQPPAHLETRLRAVMKVKGNQAEPPQKVEQLWANWPDTAVREALTIVHDEDVVWESLGKGMYVKNLFVNRAEHRVTMLVKMEAGGSYPPHVHFGPEECYVLSGDIYGDNFSMQAGDYQYAEPGSKHGFQSTKNGCVILVTSSLDDELIGEQATV